MYKNTSWDIEDLNCNKIVIQEWAEKGLKLVSLLKPWYVVTKTGEEGGK